MRCFWAAAASALLVAGCVESDGFAEAQSAVVRLMKDPGSVQFRNLVRSPRIPGGVCGEVNAKNGYGGYNGFKSFVYMKDAGAVVVDRTAQPDLTAAALRMYPLYCDGAPLR